MTTNAKSSGVEFTINETTAITLLEATRRIDQKTEEIARIFCGQNADSSNFLEDERVAIENAALTLLGVTQKVREYTRNLVSQKAYRVGWCSIEEPGNQLYSYGRGEITVTDLILWYRDYVSGKIVFADMSDLTPDEHEGMADYGIMTEDDLDN